MAEAASQANLPYMVTLKGYLLFKNKEAAQREIRMIQEDSDSIDGELDIKMEAIDD